MSVRNAFADPIARLAVVMALAFLLACAGDEVQHVGEVDSFDRTTWPGTSPGEGGGAGQSGGADDGQETLPSGDDAALDDAYPSDGVGGEDPGEESGDSPDPWDAGQAGGGEESGEETVEEGGGGDVPPLPASGTARHVRVTTTMSPSWVAWSEIEVMGRWAGTEAEPFNLVIQGVAAASSSTDDSPPHFAIDGNPDTTWNAGDFPTASWSVDLGAAAEIEQIRLRVAQNPPGMTTHVLEAGMTPGELTVLGALEGLTSNGDWLVWPSPAGDSPVETQPQPVSDLPRGLQWVRTNPMFISGLAVSMGSPTQAVADAYLEGFHATAVHTWNDGLAGSVDGWMSAGGPETRWLSWVDDSGKTLGPEGQGIGGKGPNPPGRIGYQVGDEPGLFGDGMEELLEIEKGVDAVRKADPDALIVVNFTFWAEEIEEMLDYFGSEMDADVYAYDRYAMDYKEHETLALIRDAALKWERPYWRYLRSFHYVTEGKKYGEIDYRWHAFVGLVYGYTGHTWFVYQAAPPHDVASDFYPAQGDYALPLTAEWGWAAAINLELREVGRVLPQLTSTDVRYVAGQSIYLPDGLVEWSAGAGGDVFMESVEAKETGLFDVRDLAVGIFEDDLGETFVMIQNQNHPNASFPIDNAKTTTVRVLFDFQGAPAGMAKDHVLVFNSKTGGEEPAALAAIGGGKSSLEVSLPPGEFVFFKYATGNPFPKGP